MVQGPWKEARHTQEDMLIAWILLEIILGYLVRTVQLLSGHFGYDSSFK
jgi:hypothetical protein